jgi:patatin-like phospholipase/acyl hydrolase
MTQPFRILSLDGGGITGAFAASALATFEEATGRRVVEHFDLITGSSTGESSP